MPWWGWVLVVAACAGLLTVAFRRQIGFGIRVAKRVATDERLPKPLRWALRVGLAIKAVPVPDLGIDEVLLLVVAVLLLTVYRPTLRTILAESARPG